MNPSLRYLTVPVTPYAQNCSIVWCEATREAAVIDPGGELPRLREAVQTLGVKLGAIWLTHAHIDHANGISRSDFPGGNHATLIASITGRLWPMGDDTVFIPGHGPESSFGEERRSNPYVRDR